MNSFTLIASFLETSQKRRVKTFLLFCYCSKCIAATHYQTVPNSEYVSQSDYRIRDSMLVSFY